MNIIREVYKKKGKIKKNEKQEENRTTEQDNDEGTLLLMAHSLILYEHPK